MRSLLLVVAAALAAGAVLFFGAAGLAAPTGERYRSLRRGASLIATTLLFVLALYAAHAMGLFSFPLVAVAFLVVAVPARIVLTRTKARRERERVAAPPAHRGFLARHELLVLGFLASAVAVGAAFLGVFVGTR